MISLKNKKGSHVGMVLSFTIFITAIIFAYSIIGSPFKISETKVDSIDLLKANMINQLEEDIIVARIYNTGDPCVEFDTPTSSFSSPELISIRSNGSEVDSVISGAKTQVTGDIGFVKIYYAEDGFSQTLNSPAGGCVVIAPKSVSHEKIIMEETILDTIDRIQDDYVNLTRDLKVSSDDEINILFRTSSGTIGIPTRETIKTDVYAREYSINYLSSDGKIKTGGLILNLW